MHKKRLETLATILIISLIITVAISKYIAANTTSINLWAYCIQTLLKINPEKTCTNSSSGELKLAVVHQHGEGATLESAMQILVTSEGKTATYNLVNGSKSLEIRMIDDEMYGVKDILVPWRIEQEAIYWIDVKTRNLSGVNEVKIAPGIRTSKTDGRMCSPTSRVSEIKEC